MMKKYDMIVGGESVAGSSYYDVINPASGKAFAAAASGSAADVDNAVKAASEAFKTWSQVSDEDRKSMLHGLAGLLESNMPELMQLVVEETGKPMAGLMNIGAGMEVGAAAAWAHVNADVDLPVEVIQDNGEARVELHRKPLGVVGGIAPWNWPLLIAIWQIIPALRAGNTLVLKPSPLTPVATLRFAELANTILPPGVLNVVSGGDDVGQALVEHEGVRKISFTGSTATGKAIMKGASGNLKRLTLELGGNDAGIVLDDVNVAEIAPQLVAAGFHNNGQTCAALKRLYVHESIYDELCAEMVKLVGGLKVGNGLEADVELGPLQNERQLGVVKSMAESALQDGGSFLCGGEEMPGDGYFFKPTLVTGIADGARLVDEEQFGPILPIVKFRDDDEVVQRANDNPSGLGGSVWSGDVDRAVALGKKLECGSVWINAHGAMQPNVPFGGVKQSGFGVEFGAQGLEEFTSLQAVTIPK